MEARVPTEEEIYRKLIIPHKHHLVERCKGSIKTPFGVIEGEDWYCFTCKQWIGLYGLKFETIPKPSKNAVYIEGRELTEEERKLKEKWESLPEEAKRIIKESLAFQELRKKLKRLLKQVSTKYSLSKESQDQIIKETIEWLESERKT